MLAYCLAMVALAEPLPVVEVDGSIDPGTADYVVSAIRYAEESGAPAIVVTLDTPGGLVTSAREIVGAELTSSVPVIVYVEPSGARAASAGLFLTMGGHVAAMAPGTTIGAAHPVPIAGDMAEDTPQSEKAVADTAAWARAVATERGRNADWAERAVRDSIAATAEEALREDVIDVVAEDLPTLLATIDGRTVETAAGPVVLRTADAEPQVVEMTSRQKALHFLGDPNVIFGLLTLGLLGLWVELHSPGLVLPGVLGVVLLLAAAVGLSIVPFSTGGLLLVLMGIVLLTAEIWVPGTGLLLLAGLASLVMGGLLLFDVPENLGVRIALPTLVAVGVTAAGLAGLVIWQVRRTFRRPLLTGAEALVGARGEVVDGGDGGGRVRVGSEDWFADWRGHADRGTPVRVVAIHGLRLDVEPEVPP
jgi:membrane-bound serine protease (ClpP class)